MNSNAVKFYAKSQICVIFYEELVINTVTGMFVIVTFAKKIVIQIWVSDSECTMIKHYVKLNENIVHPNYTFNVEKS